MYYRLPEDVRERARAAYQRLIVNPQHPGLQFKRLNTDDPFYSVRVTDDYRAVGLLDGDTILWYFIGPHEAYERFHRDL